MADAALLEKNYAPVWSLLSLAVFGVTNLLLRPLTPDSARENAAQTWKWRNTANSMLHSALTGVWALVCFYENPRMAEDLIGTYNTSSHLLVAVSVGYFIHDFIDMWRHHRKRSAYELMIHHICVISCFGLAEMTTRYIGYAVVALLVEVNSVFLHLRQLLIIQGVSRTSATYRLTSLLNIGTFLVFRIMTLGWMTRWLVLHRDQVPLIAYTLGSVALAVIVLMNIVLFFRILHVDFFKTKTKKETKE